ncbi:MAG: polysaccharide biosynthesis C-terminal domain-containing protein [Planctomycetes bacterium]|nr:polysaccharide biosynthesis C-terminal domain-containing protein [Planctomycetota bacterium]
MDYRRHIRLVIFSVFLQGLFYLRNIALLPIFTHALSPSEFGTWSKLHALSQFLIPIAGLGIWQGFERYLPSVEKEKRGAWISSAAAVLTVTTLAITAILYIFNNSIYSLLKIKTDSPYSEFILPAAGIMMIAMSLFHLAWQSFRHLDRSLPHTLILGLQLAALMGGSFIFWHYCGPNQWMPILTWTAGTGIAGVIFITILIRDYGWKPDRECIGKMLRYGAPLIPVPALLTIAHVGDLYLLEWLRPDYSATEIGIYSANYRLGGIAFMVASPFLVFYVPRIVKLWDNGHKEDCAHLTRQTVKYLAIATVPFVFASPIIGGRLIDLVSGAEYRTAMPVMFSVLAGHFFLSLGQITDRPLVLREKTWTMALITLAVATVNICLNLILIPKQSEWGGLNGAAIATAISFFVYAVLNRAASAGEDSLPVGVVDMLRVIVAGAAGAGAASLIFNPEDVMKTCLAAALGLAVYTALLLLSGTVKRSELEALFASARRQ